MLILADQGFCFLSHDLFCDDCEQTHNSNLFCLSSCISLFGKTKNRKWSWNHIVHSNKQLCLAFAQLIYSFIQLKTSKEYVIKLASKLRYKLQLRKESLYHDLSPNKELAQNFETWNNEWEIKHRTNGIITCLFYEKSFLFFII